MSNKIAIIGISALVPENKNEEEFWQALLQEECLISKAGEKELRKDPSVYFEAERGKVDKTYCLGGAFVKDFTFDGKGYHVPESELKDLDPLFHWTLHTARAALANAGYWQKEDALKRCGVLVGNLSFPTRSSRSILNSLYSQILGSGIGGEIDTKVNIDLLKKIGQESYYNVFSGETISKLTSRALGIKGRHYSLDAACSSALYSIRLASEYLRSGSADLMLAGAVSAADPVFINMGFSYYHAFPNEGGVSNPLEKSSGGLTPAEGAGFVVLKRLEDAIRDQDTILAVVHGTGLSNDGKGKFLLSPQSKGQVDSFVRAYDEAQISPDEISYVECHATGTPVGDATELESIRTFYSGGVPKLGAVKSNTGHLLTAAGIPGIVKVINSLHSKRIPATIGIRQALGLEESLVTQTMGWPKDKPLLAGINAFGFGGTNAHMILGTYEKEHSYQNTEIKSSLKRVAITGWDIVVGKVDGIRDFNHVVKENTPCFSTLPVSRWQGIETQNELLSSYGLTEIPRGNYLTDFEFDNLRYKILPKEADIIVAQQLLILKVADKAIQQAKLSPGKNIGVIIAMQPELALHKYTGRRDLDWQIQEALEKQGYSNELIQSFQERAKNFLHAISQENNSVSAHTGVTGNLMACRISSLWDFTGPAFTVSCGDDSFLKVLELAKLLMESKVCDGVVVGGVDIAGEYEHMLLRTKLDASDSLMGEGAAAFVLQPEENVADSSDIWAYVDELVIQDNMSATEFQNLVLPETLIQACNTSQHYLEISGKGTAASSAIAALQQKLSPSVVGSVKDVVGYTYSASGAVSLAKALVQLNQNEGGSVLIASAAEDTLALAHIRSTGNTALLKQYSNELIKKNGTRIQMGGTRLEYVFDLSSKLNITIRKEGELKKISMQTTTERLNKSKKESDTFTFEEAMAGKLPVLKKNVPNVIWNEKDLLEFAGGSISKVFGEPYLLMDSYRRKVRLPLPPYLLVSRVTQLNAKLGEFKPSTMTTEYDIPHNAWYSVDGQAPWAVSVESGQCDLMLISYLGIDFENKGERIYRLLDCTLTFLDELPKEGQTLRYEISINSFVRTGENLLFFFSYNCYVEDKLVLKMTNGCAGFFSDEDLEAGQGVVRTKMEIKIRESLVKKHFVPVKNTNKRSFSKADLLHLVNGKPELCFGPSYGHQWRNPSLRLPAEPMLMLDRIVSVDPQGGPWGLGLIVAEKDLRPDDWYFPCHFKDDEVLAGSLQAEGGGQLLQFFMLYLGLHGLVKDARFQPIEGLPQKVRCRKQVTPKNTKLTYRMEIKEISLVPHPYIVSDVEVLTEDGIVAVHFENLGLRLKEKEESQSTTTELKRNDVFINEEQLSNYALGSLVKAFGKDFEPFENRVLSRQPNTDLQVVSRVLSFSGERHKFNNKPFLIAEYDVPLNPWYYRENSSPTIPYSVLMEIALQPCGVLTAQLGSTFIYPDQDVFFRNLDGEGTLTECIDLRGKTIVNKAVMTSNTAYEGNIIQKFTYEMTCDGVPFYKGTAAFGFFPKSSLVNQVGLDRGEIVPAWHEQIPSGLTKQTLDLNSPEGLNLFQSNHGNGFLKLSKPQLNFLDKLVYVKNGGKFGKGYVYGLKKIDPSDWFYNCHFYQDPVMPGSLGVEGMLQAMQGFTLLENLGQKFKNPYFSHEDQHQTKWKYRGQIIPDNKFMSLEIHITDIIETSDQIIVRGDGSLWKEDIRIYELSGLSLTVKEFK